MGLFGIRLPTISLHIHLATPHRQISHSQCPRGQKHCATVLVDSKWPESIGSEVDVEAVTVVIVGSIVQLRVVYTSLVL